MNVLEAAQEKEFQHVSALADSIKREMFMMKQQKAARTSYSFKRAIRLHDENVIDDQSKIYQGAA